MARFDRTVPPGEAGNITLELRTKGYQGKVHKTARVFSNDPRLAQTSIGLKGLVWTPVTIEPRYVQLKGIEGQEIQKEVLLKAQRKEPLRLELASASIPDNLTVTLEEKEKGRTYSLTVKEKGQSEARYRGKVKLITNYPDKPEIDIPVVIHITRNLEVRPISLTFGRIPFEQIKKLEANSRPMTRSVTVLLHKGNNLKIEKVESANSLFTASTQELQPGRANRISVAPILENLEKGNNNDRLKIYTNQKDREILEIPLSLELF